MDIHLEPFKCYKLERQGCINSAGGMPQALRWLTPVVIQRSLSALQEFMCLMVFHIALRWNLCLTSSSQRNKYTQRNLHRSWVLTHSNTGPFPTSISNNFHDQKCISLREQNGLFYLNSFEILAILLSKWWLWWLSKALLDLFSSSFRLMNEWIFPFHLVLPFNCYTPHQVFSFSFVSFQQLCFILISIATFCLFFTSSVCSFFTQLSATLCLRKTQPLHDCVLLQVLWHQSHFSSDMYKIQLLGIQLYFISFTFSSSTTSTSLLNWSWPSLLLFFYIIPLLLCNLHLDLFLSPLCEFFCALILSIVVILSNICTLVC